MEGTGRVGALLPALEWKELGLSTLNSHTGHISVDAYPLFSYSKRKCSLKSRSLRENTGHQEKMRGPCA